jgi:hypothetical protein
MLFEQMLGRIRTVPKPLELSPFGLSAERKQTPQIVEKPKDKAETKESKEANFSLDTQEVTDSSSVKPTTSFPFFVRVSN